MAIGDILVTLSNLGLSEVLLWLLTFAIVNGIMSQAGILDKAKETRAIIAVVTGFLVILATPSALIDVISNMSSGLVLIVLGILVLVIFFEIMGVKHQEPGEQTVDEKGRPVVKMKDVPFFSKHKSIMAAVLIIIFLLLFFGSGGAALLGVDVGDIGGETITSIVLIVVVILAIMWMIQGPTAK